METITSTWAAVQQLATLKFTDSLVVIGGLAVLTHLVFKQFEPTDLRIHFGLLFVIPALATIFLAQHLFLLQAITSTFALYWTTLVSSIILYRISPIHPLARYPGPLYLKTSKIWMSWIASTGKQHLVIYRLHEQYGDAVRIGPNEVSYRDPATIVPLMGPNGFAKGPMWKGRTVEHSNTALIGLTDSKEHARRRKPWTRAFTSAALKDYEEFVGKRATDLLEGLSNSKSADLNNWFGRFSFDFMSEMAFGGGSEMMREGDKEHVIETLEHSLKNAWVIGHVPWLAKFYFRIPGAGKDTVMMRKFAMARAGIRVKAGGERRDLFHHLNDEDGVEAKRPSYRQVVADGVLAIIAGSDTTAGALTAIFYSLMRHPDVYKHLQEEVDKYYPPESNALDTKFHPEMSYLTAVINEALRLYPAVPSGSQRMNRTTETKPMGPFFLPPGSSASVNVWAMQRDERFFSPAPNSFWPDRWLISSGQLKYEGDKSFVLNNNAYIPFSYGPANCVGKNLALQELRTVTCLLLQKLEFKFADGWDPEEFDRNFDDYFVSVRERLPVVITHRQKA